MSQPIRYGLADGDLGRIFPKEDGHLVMHSDYAALDEANKRNLAVIETLFAQRAELRAENERLKERIKVLNEWDTQELAAAKSAVVNLAAENKRLRRDADLFFNLWLAAKEWRDAK